MRARRHTFRQSFVVSVVASSGSVVGACSDTGATSAGTGTEETSAGSPSVAGATTTSGNGGASTQAGQMASASGGSTAGSASDPVRDGVGGTGAGQPPVAGSGNLSDDPRCPETWAAAFPTDDATQCSDEGLTCSYALDCSSGLPEFTVTCVDEKWVGPSGCDPYDYCQDDPPSSSLHGPNASCGDDGEWTTLEWALTVSNPPGPCPSAAPDEQEECLIEGGTGGGVPPGHCGYPCQGDPDTWTVFSCVDMQEGVFGAWISDGACNGR